MAKKQVEIWKLVEMLANQEVETTRSRISKNPKSMEFHLKI